MPLSSSKCGDPPPPNTVMDRFDMRFWHLDFPLNSIATIVADNETDAVIDCEFRSNLDLVGLLWTSKDKHGHPMTSYSENRNYSGLQVAFAANPADPFNFNITFTNNQGSNNVYRLFPYVVSGGTLVPDASNTALNGNGPGMSFVIADVFPDGLPALPAGGYYFVINFDNLKLGFNYELAAVDPTSIQQMFLSIVPLNYGLGSTAKVSDVGGIVGVSGQPGKGIVVNAQPVEYFQINNVDPNLRLTRGDILSISLTIPENPTSHGKGLAYELNSHTYNILVKEWYGDGTTQRFVKLDKPMDQAAWGGGKASAIKLQKDTPIGSVAVPFRIVGFKVTGTGTKQLPRAYYVQPAHNLQMTSGYDDTYNITPWRQVDNTYALGYRGHFTCYMGMSHYFKASSSGGYSDFQNKVVKDAAEPLNQPTQNWCASLFANLSAKGYTFVWSTSYEILNSYMPEEWKQRDYLGKPALSGWSPPSSFIVLSKTECLDYLSRVIKHGVSIMRANGFAEANCKFQIGEPWWWDGSYNGGAPCIYDEYTKALYTTETGNAVPLPYVTSFNEDLPPDGSPQLAYLQWLGHKLGQSTNYIRDTVKATYPTAKATLLFFTPQLFAGNAQNSGFGLSTGGFGGATLRSTINFPSADWVYPNYDFMQIEDYDWIIDGRIDLLPLTRQAAIETLGYPLAVMHYFVGFVLQPFQTWIWPNCNLAIRGAVEAGVPNVAVWAYPQVIRDGILYDDTLVTVFQAVQPDVPALRQMPAEIENFVVRMVQLCQIGDDIFMNSGDRNIDYGGQTWYATGHVGRIEQITEGLSDSSAGWTMRMTHLPLSEIDYVTESLRNKDVTLSLALLDAGNNLLHPPRVFAKGEIQSNNIELQESFAVIILSCRSRLANWKTRNNDRYTDEIQQMKFPGDRGFKFVSALAVTKLTWGDQNGGAPHA